MSAFQQTITHTSILESKATKSEKDPHWFPSTGNHGTPCDLWHLGLVLSSSAHLQRYFCSVSKAKSCAPKFVDVATWWKSRHRIAFWGRFLATWKLGLKCANGNGMSRKDTDFALREALWRGISLEGFSPNARGLHQLAAVDLLKEVLILNQVDVYFVTDKIMTDWFSVPNYDTTKHMDRPIVELNGRCCGDVIDASVWEFCKWVHWRVFMAMEDQWSYIFSKKSYYTHQSTQGKASAHSLQVPAFVRCGRSIWSLKTVWQMPQMEKRVKLI